MLAELRWWLVLGCCGVDAYGVADSLASGYWCLAVITTVFYLFAMALLVSLRGDGPA